MDVTAAVAIEAAKPLSIETVQLDGPRAGEVWWKLKQREFATPIPLHFQAKILKVFFQLF